MSHNPLYGNKPRTSPLWQVFKRISPEYAKCCLCRKTLSFKSSITNLKRHLLLKHVGAFEDILEQCIPSSTMVNEITVISLIALVKMHPCIWDARCDSYGNTELQNKAWNTIASRLCPSEDQNEVVTKLSEQFNALVNDFLAKRESGYQEELSFMEPLLNENTSLEEQIGDIEIKEEVIDESTTNNDDSTTSNNKNENQLINKERPYRQMFKPFTCSVPVTADPVTPVAVTSDSDATVSVECKLQLKNVDGDTLFLLSLVDEMKRVPSELQMNFRSDLLSAFNDLVKRYETK